jgi:Pao retrotransposon peptidase
MKITKRNVLSFVSQIYDPIGFTCPAIIQPKLQIQESWALKLGWDEEWEVEESVKVRKWYEELEDLFEIKIPRYAFGGGGAIENIQFHCFMDASQKAYAAVVLFVSKVLQLGLEDLLEIVRKN